MRRIEDIDKEKESRYIALCEKLGVFSATNNKQFEKKRKEGVVYKIYSDLLYIPKDNYDEFVSRFDQIIDWAYNAKQRRLKKDKYIAQQLVQYGAYCDRDYLKVLVHIQRKYPKCTADDMWRVYVNNLSNNQ